MGPDASPSGVQRRDRRALLADYYSKVDGDVEYLIADRIRCNWKSERGKWIWARQELAVATRSEVQTDHTYAGMRERDITTVTC
jgi:hypothetical protein